jgi:hypothetical protein
MKKIGDCFSMLFVIFIGLSILGGVLYGGISLTSESLSRGNYLLVALGFVIMFLAFLIGLGFLYIVAKRSDREPSKVWMNVILVISLLASGTIFFFQVRNVSAKRPTRSILKAVSEVCKGEGVAGAGSYEPGIAPHIVFLDGSGDSHLFTGEVRPEWKPGSLEDVNLVVCIDEPSYKVIETCAYLNSGKITRYAKDQPVRLIIAKTGELLASATLTGSPRLCQSTEQGNVKELYGDVAYEYVEKWLLEIIP